MTASTQPHRAAKRVSFLINSMEGGGAERAMANLLQYLLPRLAGCDVELVLLDDLPNAQDLPEALTVTKLDGRGKLLRSRAALLRHWRNPDHKPDVCVSFLARSNVLNVWLARRIGHRAVISERVNTSSHIAASRAAPILAAITRATYPKADHVVAVSQGVADDLAQNFGVSRGKTTVIGNAIDHDRLTKMAAQEAAVSLPEDFILGLGRLVPNKNFSLLLEAYADSKVSVPLVIVGQGPELGALEAQAERLSISDRVHFVGFVSNPYPIMAKARALVSSSRAEGFPNTIIEALTLGCPVVATDCPSGPADVLESQAVAAPPWPKDAHGILVEMEDQQAMSAAILSLSDNAIRTDFAARAKSRAQVYGVAPVVEAYLEILSVGETVC